VYWGCDIDSLGGVAYGAAADWYVAGGWAGCGCIEGPAWEE
jgi:hypothetical protein